MKGVREGWEARYLPSSPWWGAIGLGGAGLGFKWADFVLVPAAPEPDVLSTVSSAADVAFESSEAIVSGFPGWYG